MLAVVDLRLCLQFGDGGIDGTADDVAVGAQPGRVERQGEVGLREHRALDDECYIINNCQLAINDERARKIMI